MRVGPNPKKRGPDQCAPVIRPLGASYWVRLALARGLFPLTERLEPEPWMGCRPCLPDMVPVIGKGERHQGLWFAFGHAHHGFTLGPVTRRLLAEMMTGEKPFTDPSPYAACRFRN
jgi:D-amino-acid dehydrogenase